MWMNLVWNIFAKYIPKKSPACVSPTIVYIIISLDTISSIPYIKQPKNTVHTHSRGWLTVTFVPCPACLTTTDTDTSTSITFLIETVQAFILTAWSIGTSQTSCGWNYLKMNTAWQYYILVDAPLQIQSDGSLYYPPLYFKYPHSVCGVSAISLFWQRANPIT